MSLCMCRMTSILLITELKMFISERHVPVESKIIGTLDESECKCIRVFELKSVTRMVYGLMSTRYLFFFKVQSFLGRGEGKKNPLFLKILAPQLRITGLEKDSKLVYTCRFVHVDAVEE